MTDQEREDLKALSQDDLIDMIGALREKADKQVEAERKAIIKRFLGGEAEDIPEDVQSAYEEASVLDLKRNKAFQALKRRMK